MKLERYQDWVRCMWNWQDFVSEEDFQKALTLRDDFLMATGLAGETGEVMELLKKAERKRKNVNITDLTSELGDVLYYITIIAERHGITLEEIILQNIAKLEARKAAKFAKKVVQDQETAASAIDGH